MNDQEILKRIKTRFQAETDLRRGICLLNAGQLDEAERLFKRAIDSGAAERSLAAYLAACYVVRGDASAAVEQTALGVAAGDSTSCERIRHALALWAAARRDEALQTLRDGLAADPEDVELHFQLGTLLTSLERYEEAELRFTQVLNIEPQHTDALVSYALCRGVRHAVSDALTYLQRAHTQRPHDATIGLLLTQAAKAAWHQGYTVAVRATMPDTDLTADARGIEELSRLVASEPDFVDAFLSIPDEDLNEPVFSMLLATLEAALARQPEHAELHFHCGRVLARLGRPEDAIAAGERAVDLDPSSTRALIELARLYRETDRAQDATTRLEQALATGAEYADVYYQLGSLYHDQGHVGRARSAYRKALVINERFEAAEHALAALPA